MNKHTAAQVAMIGAKGAPVRFLDFTSGTLAMLRKYAASVAHRCGVTLSDAEIEDMSSAGIVKAIENYDPAKGDADMFARIAVGNVVLDYLRSAHRKAHRRGIDASDAMLPAPSTVRQIEARSTLRAVESAPLSAGDRAALARLVTTPGLDTKDRVAVCRLRKTLRALVA